jgi:broad specificity phosphatase PhoE
MLKNPAALAASSFEVGADEQCMYLVRHGDSFAADKWQEVCNEAGYSVFRAADAPLSDVGNRMARETADFLGRYRL